jgi:hypothetical protein
MTLVSLYRERKKRKKNIEISFADSIADLLSKPDAFDLGWHRPEQRK